MDDRILSNSGVACIVPDVILAVAEISLGKVERPRADVHVGVELGEAAHVPLQLLPFVAVETDAHLADEDEGGKRGERMKGKYI